MNNQDECNWLDAMPPAESFKLAWLACDASGVWYESENEPRMYKDTFCTKDGAILQVDPEIMPLISIDEWSLSRISIDELYKYQKAHS